VTIIQETKPRSRDKIVAKEKILIPIFLVLFNHFQVLKLCKCL